MFGFNDARRRKILAEESSVYNDIDQGKRMTAERQRVAPTVLKTTFSREQIQRSKDKAERVIGLISSYRPNSPKKFKAKATKGIYHSPFRR